MKKIALILCLVLVASFVLSGCNNSDSIITLEDREVGKIEIQSGNTGETVEVTEEEVISQIADILSLEFEKGEKSNDSTGWSYSVRWYDTEGKQIDTVVIMNDGTIEKDGYFWKTSKDNIELSVFDELVTKHSSWKAWMEREKEALTEIAQAHEFEIISLGGGRPHMELPEYRAAAQRLEAIQEQVTAAEQEIAALEKQRKALQGNVKLLKAVEKVKPDLDAIQPEKTLTGAVKGVTVEQVKELKAAVIRGAAAEQKVRELKVENQQLQQKIPSTKEKLKEAQERQRLENENRQLKVQVEYLEEDLSRERGFSARLREGIGAVLDFLDRHLPEQFRPLVEKARELLPVPEVQQPEREQERGHTWGGMEL